MKGIILAGGRGSRLYPLTNGLSKQLLPVYNKPLIYYPLTTLILMGVDEINIVCNPDHLDSFKKTLRNGEQFGIKLTYSIQTDPEGLPQALTLSSDFLQGESCVLILGDNFFWGTGLTNVLKDAVSHSEDQGATVFCYQVSSPERFGVVRTDPISGQALELVEKPKDFVSDLAITGLYVFDPTSVARAASLKKSDRDEYEITDLLNQYLSDRKLTTLKLGRGVAWFDAGTHDSLIELGQFVSSIERRQGILVGSPHEAALHSGLVSGVFLRNLIRESPENSYYSGLAKAVNSFCG